MRIRNLPLDSRSVPIALFFFSFISYGLLIPWLGFYWDDWPAAWYLHVFGPGGFGEVFAIDRPLLGRLFAVTTSVLGTSVIGWQIFGILARWLSSLAFWWFLRGLWPQNPRQTAAAALLFAVYPGFKQQFISLTYSHVWLIAMFFLLSYGTMVWGLRKPGKLAPYLVTSVMLAGVSLFTVEYFFGAELLRPVVIWLALISTVADSRQRIKRTLLLWLPYLLMIASFLVWRFFFQPTVRGTVDIGSKLASDPGYMLELLENVLRDTVSAGLVAWGQELDFARMTGYGSGPTLLYIAGSLVAAAAAVVYLIAYHPHEADEEKSSRSAWGLQACLVGGLALLFGGIPFWTTNLPIGLEFPWDRFTLAMIFGSSLLVAGMIDLVTPQRMVKAAVFGVIIGLAAGLHLQYSNLYRREWNAQKQFFWQLSWRAPGIQENTLLLTAELPFVYFSDNSLTAPLNWTYSPDFKGEQMPYLLYAAEARHEKSLEGFDPALRVYQPYRATYFDGSTSQTLVLYYTPPGCLKVVDLQTDKRIPQKPKFISDMMHLSDPDWILLSSASPAVPPEEIFGPEPGHGWCYYFERAELARQAGDWQHVASLADIGLALDHKLYELNASELVTYIEGYAHTGQWDKAAQLTDRTMALSERMDRMLCDTWERLAGLEGNRAQREDALASVNRLIQCKIP